MAERVPFFTLFESFQAPRQLRLLLHDACIISGALDMAGRTLEVQIESSETLPQAAQDALQQMLAQQYDLRQVLLHFCGTGEQKGDNGVIWGKTITGKLTPIGELNIKQGSAIVEGRVFKAECYETRRKGMWTLNFNITDEHGSVAVRKAMDEKEAKVLGGAINDGMWLRLQGKVELTYDGKDILLRPVNIMKISHTARQDNAPEKRVELHLHTQMSSMDALTDVGKVVKQAAAWGHPAIAITDHGTVQAFPKARDAGKGKIKILYGVEGYYVNNLDDRIAVHGAQDQDFDDEIVCFDIETTGLKVQREAITEIGAVVLKNGKITDTFQTFVNPGRRLTPEIIGLTGITDAMLADAPPPENPKPAAPEKPTSEKERQKRVYAYIAVLFTVAFILILWSFLANHRSNQQVIDQLKGSTSMMQSTLEQNAKLEDEVKALETQVGELEQTLAETEDALSAAQEETEKYRALYEELAGEESGTP